MRDQILHTATPDTPAYIYDQTTIMAVLQRLGELKRETGCRVLYSIKAASLSGLLALIKPHVDGFSCSSLFELKLAREVLAADQSAHITTPGYRAPEWEAVIGLSDAVSLNSIRQWRRYAGRVAAGSSCGLRINPELSFVADARYDPCRPDSKLGMTLDQIASADAKQALDWSLIQGVHLHNNCESTEFEPLKQSAEKIMRGLLRYPLKLQWINLGGGYLFHKAPDLSPLAALIRALKSEYHIEVYLEPGKAITGHAGYLVAGVTDVIETKNRTILMLDASVNHLPEVFEYQYQPRVTGATPTGAYQYRLAGASCLSGDLFGDYGFAGPLGPGRRVVFENVGAYMQVKAHLFNGINLPAAYLLDADQRLRLLRQYDYAAWRARL